MSSSSQASQRLYSLLDENSFVEIGALVKARNTDFNLKQTDTPSDGVTCGYGMIDGKLVYVYAQDASVLGGSVGEMHAKKIANLYDLALKMGAPVIGLIDSAGLRLQEATDALNAFGEIYRKQIDASGVVPQITAVLGSCGGGLSLFPEVTDFTFMEEKNAKLFVNSPNAIPGNSKEKCDTSSASWQSSEVGSVDVTGDEETIFAQIRELVSLLPSNNEDTDSFEECTDDLNRVCENLEGSAADPALIFGQIADNGVFFETKRNYAKDMVTGFIRLGGATVGVFGNRSALYDEKGEVAEKFEDRLTAHGCEKAAELVRFCDAFDIPVLSITNVTGFSTTMCAEKNLAKAMASLTAAFANADVPKVNLITEEAYGSAYVVMNSKSVGADLVYAWNGAKVGMMDSEMAAKIMYPDANADELKEKRNEYEALCANASAAASRGYVDFMLEPADTRKYLVAAFELLYSKCVNPIDKKHTTK